MVAHNAEYALVVVCCGLRCKGDNDSCLWLCIYNSLNLWEWEQVFVIGEKLESGCQITIIVNVQKTIRVASKLNLTKVDRICRQAHTETLSMTDTRESEVVTTNCFDFVLSARREAYNWGHILDSYFEGGAWWHNPIVIVNGKSGVFAIVIDLIYWESSRHQWVVLEDDIFLSDLTHQKSLEVKLLMVDC